jgi:Tfp pilus assembly protein PilO
MRRGTALIAVLGVLAITALWWVFLAAPRNAGVGEVEDEIEVERNREATLRQQIANLQSIKDQEVTYLFAIGQMENAIPEFSDVDTFLEEINFLASRTGVVLQQVSLATPSTLSTPAAGATETAGPLSINITLNIEGQYFEVLGFVYGLEAMERLVRLENVSLRPIEAAQPDDEGPEEDDTPDNLAEGPRPRPEVTTLSASFTAVLFTRNPVIVEVIEDAVTTTTVAGEDDSSTTTAPDGDGE